MLSFADRFQPREDRRVKRMRHGARAAQPVVELVVRHIEQRGKRFQRAIVKFRKVQRGKSAEDRIGFLEAAVRGAKLQLFAADFGWGLVHEAAV